MAPGTLQLSVGTPAELTLARACGRGAAARVGLWPSRRRVVGVLGAGDERRDPCGGAESVQVRLDEAAVTVVVEDASPSGPQMRPGGDASGGFGLRIVDQLATEWGWEQTGTGKQVWAKVRCFD